MKLLLDTCSLLWLATEPDRLSTPVKEAIDAGFALLLSDGSVMELCLKWTAGKLKLPQPPRLWVEEQLRTWKIAALPVERRHHYRSTELPDHHRDPFDRLLVAQALEENLTIATPDPLVRRYPVSTLW